MNRQTSLLITSLCFLALALSMTAFSPADASALSVSGLVKQPLNLSVQDLNRYQSLEVQLNEVERNGDFRGNFLCRGVPLRALLETACVAKEESPFNKKTDLAILIKNTKGEQVALSWGEVFYKNPGNIIVATAAVPIMPHGNCTRCHQNDEHLPWVEPLKRTISFPKLVISTDMYGDRSLDGIVSIEVLDLRPAMPAEKKSPLFSDRFTITGKGIKDKVFTRLPKKPRRTLVVKHVGEGKGYHGIHRFEGVPLKSFLEGPAQQAGLDTVFFFSAPDGYRSLLSYGELFLDPSGERMIIADKDGGKPIKADGKFCFVPPDDLFLDREIKALEKIEVISLAKPPRINVIGIGSGDTSLISLEAISYMAKAEAYHEKFLGLIYLDPGLEKRHKKCCH